MSDVVPKRKWTMDDLFKVRHLSDAQVSPDGRRVAFTVRYTHKEDGAGPKSHVWMTDLEAGETAQFTSGPRSDSFPRWSPDSETLLFLSDQDEEGRQALYTIPADGGEASRLVETKGPVSAAQWSPDGGWIAFLMTDPETEEEKKRKEDKDDAIEFERKPKYQRVWVVEASGSEPACVTTGNVQVWELAWFPDGQRLALVCSGHPYEWSWYESYVATVPASGGEVLCVHRGPKTVALPAPSPDGSGIAFVSGTWSDRGVVNGDVFVVPSEGGEPVCLTAGYLGSFSWLSWNDERELLAVGLEDGEAALFTLGTGSPPHRLWSAEAAIADRGWPRASRTTDGSTIAVVREDHAAPQDVWTATVSGAVEWRRRTELQPELAEFVRGEPETLRWRAPDGTPVQGILLAPALRREGERLPMVTIVHGGPTGLVPHSFITSYAWAPLLVSNGFAVLMPNFRGSVGWGTAFSEANLGGMGGGDLEDVLSGVDAAVERGIADPERLGVGGWSYGGFMTAWIITRTDRFRAAVMGAGISNWRSFHGVTNIPTWDARYYQEDPYRQGGRYDHFSAVYHADEVSTPLLILHGENDPCVPVGQAYEYFRALEERGKQVRLVVYPREGHGVAEKAHVADLGRRVLDWYVRHLGCGPREAEGPDQSSP